MLKELFEAHFYSTFPKVEDRVLMVEEWVKCGEFSLLDPKACIGCRVVCSDALDQREQLRLTSTFPVAVVNMEQVFNYVKEDIGEVCDYMVEGPDKTFLIEMTCSTADYVKDKRAKARGQVYNTLEKLYSNPFIRAHFEKKLSRFVVFSWKETFPCDGDTDVVEDAMRGMTVMSDVVYSPDNETKFDFDFKLREIRYPDVLTC